MAWKYVPSEWYLPFDAIYLIYNKGIKSLWDQSVIIILLFRSVYFRVHGPGNCIVRRLKLSMSGWSDQMWPHKFLYTAHTPKRNLLFSFYRKCSFALSLCPFNGLEFFFCLLSQIIYSYVFLFFTTLILSECVHFGLIIFTNNLL